MNFPPPGSPYTVCLPDGNKIVSIYDLRLGEPLILLLHMSRTFRVSITCPDDNGEKNADLGFLWLPLSEKEKLDNTIKKDRRLTWKFVCVDLINGDECAFYRDYTRKTLSVSAIAKTYFGELNKTLEVH